MKRVFVLCFLVLVLLQGCSVPPINEIVKVLNWFNEHTQEDPENQNSIEKRLMSFVLTQVTKGWQIMI